MTDRPTVKLQSHNTCRVFYRLTTMLVVTLLIFSAPLSTIAADDASSPAKPEAEASPRKILAVSVGIGGVFKPGAWTPVDVRLEGSAAGQLIVETPDCEGVRAFFSAPIAADTKTARCYIRPGHVQSELTITVTVDDQPVCRAIGQSVVRPENAGGFLPVRYDKKDELLPIGQFDFYEGISATRCFTVVVSGRSAGVQSAAGTITVSDEPPVVVRLTDITRLPDMWFGLDAVDSVAICADDPRAFKTLRADSPALVALVKWMELGGTVLLCVGERAEEVLADGSPLAIFAPGRFQQRVDIHQGEALESYIGSTLPIAASAAGGRLDWSVPLIANIEGTIEVIAGQVPLVVRTPRQFGRSVFLVTDFSTEPLKSWPDRDRFIARLLDWPGSADTQLQGGQIPEGYIDLSGQLRSALDSYQQVTVVPFWVVWSLILLYILLVGPIAYYVLHRSVRRVVLAWTILPILAIAFCAGGYFLAVSFRPAGIAARQADLVDIDLESGQMRGTSWLGIYSGDSQRLDMSIRPTVWGEPRDATSEMPERQIGFFGLAGTGFGGMSAPIAESLGTMVGYRYNKSLNRMSGVPLAVRSSRSFMARWNGAAISPIHIELAQTGDSISGEIVNFSGITFDDCMLVYKRWAYRIGRLEPGDKMEIEEREGQIPLRSILTGRERYQVKKQTKFRMTPYNRLSSDPWYILRSISFFEILGGKPYTGLANGQTDRFDLSDRLGEDRAVLIARPVGPTPAAIWTTGSEQSIIFEREKEESQIETSPQDRPVVTMLRIIAPVEPEKYGASESLTHLLPHSLTP